MGNQLAACAWVPRVAVVRIDCGRRTGNQVVKRAALQIRWQNELLGVAIQKGRNRASQPRSKAKSERASERRAAHIYTQTDQGFFLECRIGNRVGQQQ